MLTAGLGTRLRPLTRSRAKAAVPVDGEPLALRVIRWLVDQGITDLVLNLHHQAASITGIIGDGNDCGARIRYSWEWPLLGSAGGPRHALPLLTDGTSDRTILLVNGDTLTDVDLRALEDQHRRRGALVTMALIANEWPEKYGGVLLDVEGAVTGFTRRGDRRPSFHFIGVQAAHVDVFSSLEDGVPAESVLGVYPQLMAANRMAVQGFVSSARFQDIGTPRDLLTTSLELAEADGRPGSPRSGHGVSVDPSATIERSLLWDHVTVKAHAHLEECVVADGVTIPSGARFARCAIVRADGAGVDTGQRMMGDLVVADF